MNGFLPLTGVGIGDAVVTGGLGAPISDDVPIASTADVTAKLLSEAQWSAKPVGELTWTARHLPS